MFRIILSLQLTVLVFTALSVEEPQSVEYLQLDEEPLTIEDDVSRDKLTVENSGPPSNAQFVPIPVVPIPGHLSRPFKTPGKGSGPPPPPKRRPSKRPKPVRPLPVRPEVQTIKPLPPKPTIRPVPITTRLPVELTTAKPFEPTKRPIRTSTTPQPGRPTHTRPVTTRPTNTKEPLTGPPRRTTTIRPTGPVPLVHSTHILEDDGSYFFDFLAENSVQRAEKGFFKTVDGEEFPVLVKIGNYSFTSPEGRNFKVEYVADENGYRASDT